MANKVGDVTRGLRLRSGSYEFRRQINGKSIYERLGTDDLATAIRLKAEIIGNPFLAGSNSMDDEISRFIAYKIKRREYTVATTDKAYILRKFGHFIGGLSVAYVTKAHVQHFYNDSLDKLAIVSANTYLLAIRSFLAWAVKTGLIRTNPALGIEPVKDDGAKMKDFLSEEQFRPIIHQCEDPEIKFILFCGFHAGLRKLEIVEAVPWWFDIESGRLHLRKTPTIRFKDREERAIPMSAHFVQFLRTEYPLRSPFMIAPQKKHGRGKYRFNPTKRLHAEFARHGHDWASWHTMRHSFASTLAMAGKSLYQIALYMGDDPRTVERRYAKLRPKTSDLDGVFHTFDSSLALAAAASSQSKP